jgi:gliding motility-associated protein GldM
MAGQKLSPRQKMIGMMYLVLTALLALNVSKEIINAFVTVNDSLELSKQNAVVRNDGLYNMFERAMKNDPTKTKPFNDRAQKIRNYSKDLNQYIIDIKNELISKVEGLEEGAAIPAVADIARKDDYDIPTNIMCGDKADGVGHKATELKGKMDEFKANILKTLSADDRKLFQTKLEQIINTSDPAPELVRDDKRTWEMATFYHNPIVATLALLTKFQSDVRNVESELVSHLLSSIDAENFKFDALQARVIAPTSYVLLGQEYTADVFLAAFSTTSNPEITLEGGQSVPVEGGLGKYTHKPTSPGLKKWGGVIKIKKPDNTWDEYPFEQEYIASKPAAVVSPDKMNVIYIGVDNPMSISVPGVADANVLVSTPGNMGGLKIKKNPKAGGGKYIATARAQSVKAKISVSAKLGEKNVPMGSFEFRIKRVPDPVAMIGGKKGGSINKSVLAAQSSVNSIMENFDFELYFKVKSFRMTLIRRGKDPVEMDAKSSRITADMKRAIRKAGPGSKVYFEYIKASGPDGTTRKLSSVNFVLQ